MEKNYFKISKDELTSLYVSQASEVEEFILYGDHKANALTKEKGSVVWNVETEQSNCYKLAICVACPQDNVKASVSCGETQIDFILPKTKSYFKEQVKNFERFSSDITIRLDAGNHEIKFEVAGIEGENFAVSSVELYPVETEAVREEMEKLAEIAKAKVYDLSDGYGMMFHWTSQCYPRHGELLNYNEAVNQFDTDKFAKMLHDLNVKFVFITMNHAIEHFPAPLTVWNEYFPNMTTTRDLVEDLYVSLSKYDIKLMMYLNFIAAYKHSPLNKLPDPIGPKFADITQDMRECYTKMAIDILTEIGQRYGDKLCGYWFDSCFQLPQQFGAYDFKDIYDAAKIGNEKRLVTFNFYDLPVTTPWLDCWAGEAPHFLNVPEKNFPDYGCAKNLCFHDTLTVEPSWLHRFKDTPIPEPKWTGEELTEYVKACNKIGGIVTINAKVYQNGEMSKNSFDVLKYVGENYNK